MRTWGFGPTFAAMQTIRITKPFAYAHGGRFVERYDAGEQDVPDDVAEVALAEGWAVRQVAAINAAPETKPRKRRQAK